MTMTVLKTSLVFANQWMTTRMDATAACPTPEGDYDGRVWVDGTLVTYSIIQIILHKGLKCIYSLNASSASVSR